MLTQGSSNTFNFDPAPFWYRGSELIAREQSKYRSLCYKTFPVACIVKWCFWIQIKFITEKFQMQYTQQLQLYNEVIN